jgi:hypothetical protein
MRACLRSPLEQHRRLNLATEEDRGAARRRDDAGPALQHGPRHCAFVRGAVAHGYCSQPSKQAIHILYILDDTRMRATQTHTLDDERDSNSDTHTPQAQALSLTHAGVWRAAISCADSLHARLTAWSLPRLAVRLVCAYSLLGSIEAFSPPALAFSGLLSAACTDRVLLHPSTLLFLRVLLPCFS